MSATALPRTSDEAMERLREVLAGVADRAERRRREYRMAEDRTATPDRLNEAAA